MCICGCLCDDRIGGNNWPANDWEWEDCEEGLFEGLVAEEEKEWLVGWWRRKDIKSKLKNSMKVKEIANICVFLYLGKW
jgi:hypothetical protein